jgi:head-tail adaptor
MQAGKLTQIVSFYEPNTIRTQSGAESTTYELCYECRASVTYANLDRVNENGDIFYSRAVKIEIRTPFREIDERMQIIWHSKKYRIISVEPRSETQSVVIYSELINE